MDLEYHPSDDRGMTPRVFEYLFSKIQKVRRGIDISVLDSQARSALFLLRSGSITVSDLFVVTISGRRISNR